MKSLAEAEEELKAGKQESKFREVARAIQCTQNVVSRLVNSKDLWPSEEVLVREGLFFDRGGSHSRKWSDVLRTLQKLKQNPTENFSTIDLTKQCRSLNFMLQGFYPACGLLSRIKNLTLALEKLIDSASEAMMDTVEKNGYTFLGDESDISQQQKPKNHPVQNQGNEQEIELIKLIKDSKISVFRRSHPDDPSISQDEIRVRGKMQRINEILSTIKIHQKELLDAENDFFDILEEGRKHTLPEFVPVPAYHFSNSPTGSSPLHAAVMMGLKSTTIKLIERYFATPELLSQPVVNDLNPWRIKRSNDDWEDGMRTGETVLHIAIVQEDSVLVQYLLEKGINIVSRASGVFFQPKTVPLRVPTLGCKNSGKSARMEDGDDVNYLRIFSRTNEDSACYYGEYPLSFSASVGNCEICELLYTEMQRRLAARPSHSQGAPLLGAAPKSRSGRSVDFQITREEDVADMSAFLSATDMFGNTAMHMAALHERTDVIDWLMSKAEGADLLEMLNLDGLTPFTLAVRYGKKAIYHHILYSYLSRSAWSYGRVRMRKTDLLQVDSFRIDGARLHANRSWRSALELVVALELEAFADDPLLAKLVAGKWERFGRRMYLRSVFFPYIALLACFVITAMSPPSGALVVAARPSFMENLTSPETCEIVERAEDVVAAAVATVLFLLGPPWLLGKAWGRGGFSLKDLDRDGDGQVSAGEVADFVLTNMEGFLDTAAASLLAGAGVARVAGAVRAEADCLAGASVVLFFNLLHVLAPFRFFGGLMVTVHKMLRGDVPRFMVLYVAMHTGFGFARMLLLRRARDEAAAAGSAAAAEDGAAAGSGAVPSEEDYVSVLFNPFWVAHFTFQPPRAFTF